VSIFFWREQSAPIPIQKARGWFSRRGLNACDDEDMPVICPTCQIF
jgi:hypothetical protein